MNDQTTYPVGHQFSLGFNPIEDRLVLTTELKEAGTTYLLLTRRMVLLMLAQIVHRLPALSGLDQTPANYWQEVLQFTHQQAMEQHRKEVAAPRAEPESTGHSSTGNAETKAEKEANPSASSRAFIATELTCQQADNRLQLAFKGVPVINAMQSEVSQLPVLALSLEATHAHQVIQLMLTRATQANWHLPVDLPWATAEGSMPSAQTSSH